MAYIFDTSKGETPQTIELKRKLAQAMTTKGSDYSPIASPWQGAARVAQAMLGGLEEGRLDASEAANRAAGNEAFAKIAGLISGQPATASASPAPSISAPMGATSIPAGKEEFVSTLMPLAQEASAKTGVDPRVIVAQAALESGWGKSAPGNNLFGIKSHGQPGGNILPTTEVVNGQPVKTTDSFRAYASPADSVSGYADFINKNPRYAALKSAPDLESQIAALGKSGYATDPNYAAKVGSIARNLPQIAPVTNDGMKFPNVDNQRVTPQNTTPDGMNYPNIDNAPPITAGGMQTVGANQPSPLDTAQWPSGPIGAPGDPAAIPANARPAQGMAPQPAQPQRQPGPDLQTLIQAASNPWLNEGQRVVVQTMLKQRLEEQQHANDPLRQLQIQKAQADLQYGKNPESVREYQFAKEQGFAGSFQDWIAAKRGGAGEYGLTPVMGTGPDGKPALLQLGKNGKPIMTPLPEGFTIARDPIKVVGPTGTSILDPQTRNVILFIPNDIRGAAREHVVGESQGKIQSTLPSDIVSANQTITQIDQLLGNKGLDAIVGPLDQFRPSWTLGSEGRDALARYNQLKGKAFLQAYSTLRGGGAITEVEGVKAENAMARMDRAQSEADFRAALKDFRDAVAVGLEKLKEKAGVAPTATGSVPPPASLSGNTTSSGVKWSVE